MVRNKLALQDEGADSLEKHIGFLVHDVARSFTTAYAGLVKPVGLTRPQARVIAYVARYPGISQTDLATYLNVGNMSITGVLDRMEEKELVKRGLDPTDRRVRRVFLTKEGSELHQTIQEIVGRLTTSATKGFSTSNIEQLAKLLHVMEGNLADLIAELATEPSSTE